MSLIPLPVTQIGASTEEALNQSKPLKLPYPELGQSQVVEKPTLRRQWGEETKSSSEQQRLSELEKMLSEAQSRTAIVEQEAYDKAYAAGEKAGLTLGEKRAEQIIETMEGIVAQAEQELRNLQYKSVGVIVELTESVAKKVVGEATQDISSTLEHAVEKTLKQLQIDEKHEVVLAVHPADLEAFKRMSSVVGQLKIQADERICQGSCRLLSDKNDTLIDPNIMIEKAVGHIKQQFLSMYGK